MYRNRRINKNNKFNYKKLLEFEYISFVVPIYNEEKRLPFLFNYLKNYSKKNKHKEVIFVDDGSNDKSKVMIKNFIIKNKEKKINYKLISYKKNMGKGYALKKGILKSNKKWILTVDADLSVDFSQLEIWKKKNYLIETENIAYFGSRIIKGSKMKAILIRKFIGFFFRIFQNLLISSEIKDTQCGFKLYNASYVKGIFTKLKTFGFAHDVEIIHLLQNENIKILELPIIWIHKSGSKINIMLHSFTMFFEIIKIKLRFMLK